MEVDRLAPVAGAVLTGGASRRMGTTKALVEVDGTAMARRVADALLAAGCHPVQLIGGDPAELARLGMAVVPDRYPGAGPLGGVITALESAGGAVMVVACDLPRLTGGVVATILAVSAEDPVVDVIVARTAVVEPACALWRPSALPALAEAFAAGERALHRALGRLHSVEVPVPPDALANINAPGDLGR